MELNDAQQRAVAITTGPALVVAGAGTGKTRVITERIRQLTESGVPANQILALTFTEKAAGEMETRVNETFDGVLLDATIMTFNGFGQTLLDRYGAEWGLGPLRLLGETGKLVFLREHLDDFALDYFAPVSRPEGQLKLLADYVSALKQQVIMPADYQRYASGLASDDAVAKLEKQKQTELGQFYERYLALCRQAGVIDYDDQLFLTLTMLQRRPNVLAQLQAQYRYILVDEFQDTNPLQSALIDLLAGQAANIMVVGDDDQSIYGWRGATLANILDFSDRYPQTQEVTLIENYRSSQAILDSAYNLIQHNNPERLEIINKLDKRLVSQTAAGPTPQAHHFASLDAELAWLANDMSARLKRQPAGSIAVLARRNQTVQKVHEFLELYGVAHNVAGLGNDIYREPAVQQLIEALKTVADPLDSLALFHVLSGPLFQLDIQQLATVSAQSKREHTPLQTALEASENTAISAALATIDLWRVAGREHSVGTVAYQIITDSGWKQQLYDGAEHDAEMFRQVQALSKFFKTLQEFASVSDVASVQSYITNLPTLKAAGSGFEDVSLDITDDQLNVLSVHRAKGLEWDTVYIVDCTEGSFPMRNFGTSLSIPAELRASQTAADEHLAEERRLMYVAATRARQELLVSYSDTHSGNSKRKPSRFLSELLGDDFSTEPATAGNSQTELELFAPKQATAAALPSSLQPDGHITLSVSQIDCYLRCPQDFYYLYVLQMPVPPEPALQYGTAIHSAIETIHKGLASGAVPSLKTLLTSLRQTLPSAGYASPRSRERAHQQAEATLRKLYAELPERPQPAQTEQPFRVTVPDTSLQIVGRIDIVYNTGKGVEIRDFKTGTGVTTPEKAKQRATSSNQLTLYALAWQLQHAEMPALLTLDFVETGQIGSVRKQPKSLETLTAKLQAMVTNLQAGHYEPGSDHTYCKHPY